MKHLKTYEQFLGNQRKMKVSGKDLIRRRILASAALYLEENQSVAKEEGFIKCNPFEKDKNTVFIFYFEKQTLKNSFKKFYDFLRENNLEIISETEWPHNLVYMSSLYDIVMIKLSEDKIKEYANFYDDVNKYNL